MAKSMEKSAARVRGEWSGWRIAGWGAAGALLLLPLVAMQFTDEVKWDLFDFIFAGALIGGTGLVLELTVRATRSTPYRAGVAVALAAAFLIIWLTGAVGIIGTEDNPANLMFGGVLAIVLAGAVLARFQPQGMARAALAAAVAQTGVGIIALAAGLGSTDPSWPFDVAGLTGFFAVLWLVASSLFRKAAEAGSR